MFLGNMVIEGMRKPSFEESIDTVEDLVKYNLTLLMSIRNEEFKHALLKLNITAWTHVGNNMESAERCARSIRHPTVEECSKMNGTFEYYVKHHVHGNRTHAFINKNLLSDIFKIKPHKKDWWRSQPLNISYPFSSLLTAKNWILNEV